LLVRKPLGQKESEMKAMLAAWLIIKSVMLLDYQKQFLEKNSRRFLVMKIPENIAYLKVYSRRN
jgi:hypothetical protein